MLATLLSGLVLSACAPSDHELVELGRRGAIQDNAPVKSISVIAIHAPAPVVWRLLTDVTAWPHWQSGVETASSNGPLGEGTRFTWKTGGTTIHSSVALFDPPHRLAWIGRADMAHAIHVFVLTSLGPRDTRVESRESMDGPLLDWFYDSAELQSSENTLLKNLERAAEATNASAVPTGTSHAPANPLPQASPHQRN